MPNLYRRFRNFLSREPKDLPEEKLPTVKKSIPDEEGDMVAILGGKFYSYWLGEGEKAYGTNYIVHRCVSLLGSNLAKLPLRVYRGEKILPPDYVLKGRGDIKLNLRQPHPRMSLSMLLYQCGIYYWYKGEFMSLIDEAFPFSLEPINPGLMKIKDARGTMVENWLLGNDKNTVPADKLIYANVFNPDINGPLTNQNRTLSPVKVVKAELKNYLSGREFNTQFFSNFAQVGLTLKDIDASTTREEREAIVRELDNTIKAGNAWRTKCLPQGLDIADTKNTTLKEMQLNELFKDLRDIILGIYGVPRSVFGITNEAGLAQNTVDAEKRIMWTDTIQPVAFLIQEAINQTLMKQYFPGYSVKFDYSDVKVLQDDMVQKANLAKLYRDLSYTTNEINGLVDLGMENIDDPVLNGRYIPINLESHENMMENSENTDENDEKDEKIAEITDLLVKMDEDGKKKDPPGLRKKYESKLRGHYSKQLGKMLGIVKNDDFSDKTALLTQILDFLDEDKATIKEIIGPFFEKLEEIKPKELTGEETKRITSINNYVYRRVKRLIIPNDDVEKVSQGIIALYKRIASRAKKLLKQEVVMWLEE